MGMPNTRIELIGWCLRKLGAPVIKLNLDEDQIEDRIDEGLAYFRDYHFDGVELCYLKHEITASNFLITVPLVGIFKRNQILIGATSNAEAYFYDVSGLNVRFSTKSGIFIPGETVTNQTTGDTFIIDTALNSITIGDIDTKSIPVSDRVISVTDIMPAEGSPIGGGGLGGVFSADYQWRLNNMYSLMSTDLITYQIYKTYMSTWEFLFRGTKGLRFNRKASALYIDVNEYMIGQFVIVQAWVALDPEQHKKVYGDEIVRAYCHALIKEQWGSNLKKFSGIQLPGGVTLNGQTIYDEAQKELENLRQRIRKEFELPPDMQVG
jgi:hypothetical protein